MPGLGWGEKDNMTPAERKAAKDRAKQQMKDQKPSKSKTDKTPRSNPRHSRGTW